VKTILRFVQAYWLPLCLLQFIVITVLSLIPLPELPPVPGSDKTHHLIAYGSLMFPLALRRPRYWWWVALAFVAWSGGIELIQPFVNRYAEWMDLLANVVGLCLGDGLARLCRRFGGVSGPSSLP
jgi:VanZ family protein